jgi:hypothetical protein
MEQFILASG